MIEGQLMAASVDLRVVKTRDAIERALIRLLQTKDFERITVQNILDEALVNRKTFYKHYDDKYNLADAIMDNLIDHFRHALDKRFSYSEGSADFPKALGDFYESILKDRDAMLALFKVRTPKHYLWDDFKELLLSSYSQHTFEHEPPPSHLEISYLKELYATIALGSIKWFLEIGNHSATDVIVDVSSRRTHSPMYGIIGIPFD